MPSLFGVDVRWGTLAAFAALSVATLAVGGAFTRIDAWYAALEKPAWTPPGAVIGVVWWTIFALLALAMALVWDAGPRDRLLAATMGALAVNLVLNVAWSWLFFTRRDPRAALAEIAVLWMSVLALAALSWPRSRVASALLLPYLVWVAFAAYLTQTIVRLNG